MRKSGDGSFAAFAGQLADCARQISMVGAARGTGTGKVDNKAAGKEFDPVTDVDRQVELALRAMIEDQDPDHGIRAEEYGSRDATSNYVWVIDPIDGTRSLICGLPGWTTLIALLQDEKPILGLIDAPVLDERYLGAGGAARLVSGRLSKTLSVSGCTELGAARLSTTDPYLFEGAQARSFERLRTAVRVTRFGYDAYAYARLAAGDIDLVVESGLSSHDFCALVPVI
jgi:histidinol phosphatase-like enzyme (inositol monophosphatase family)